MKSLKSLKSLVLYPFFLARTGFVGVEKVGD